MEHLISKCIKLRDCLIAQPVEHCTGIAEVIGSKPVEAWIFHNCLRCVYNCDDQSCPQFSFYWIFRFRFLSFELKVILHIAIRELIHVNIANGTCWRWELYRRLAQLTMCQTREWAHSKAKKSHRGHQCSRDLNDDTVKHKKKTDRMNLRFCITQYNEKFGLAQTFYSGRN